MSNNTKYAVILLIGMVAVLAIMAGCMDTITKPAPTSKVISRTAVLDTTREMGISINRVLRADINEMDFTTTRMIADLYIEKLNAITPTETREKLLKEDALAMLYDLKANDPTEAQKHIREMQADLRLYSDVPGAY